jgi:hypothetical protein
MTANDWTNLLIGAGSVLEIDPDTGPPLDRQRMAAAREARLKKYLRGRKYIVKLLRPVASRQSLAAQAARVAEGVAEVVTANGLPVIPLTEVIVIRQVRTGEQTPSEAAEQK